MAIPLQLSDAADLIDRSIQKVFLKAQENLKETYKGYYSLETGITDYYTKDSSLSGMGYAARVVENASITAESPVQGYDQTYT